jgi:hypothetical protein
MTEPRECCREAAKAVHAQMFAWDGFKHAPIHAPINECHKCDELAQIIAKHCHAEAAKGRQSNLGAPGAHAEPWTIEVGPVPNRGQNETPYEDVSYSVRYPSGSFEVRQRVPNTAEGYAKAYARVARIVAGAPGAGQAGSRDDSRLLLMRDALVVGNYGEAYNQLYHYVDAGRGLFDPWTTLSASPSEPKAAPEKENESCLGNMPNTASAAAVGTGALPQGRKP